MRVFNTASVLIVAGACASLAAGDEIRLVEDDSGVRGSWQTAQTVDVWFDITKAVLAKPVVTEEDHELQFWCDIQHRQTAMLVLNTEDRTKIGGAAGWWEYMIDDGELLTASTAQVHSAAVLSGDAAGEMVGHMMADGASRLKLRVSSGQDVSPPLAKLSVDLDGFSDAATVVMAACAEPDVAANGGNGASAGGNGDAGGDAADQPGP